MKLTCVEPCLCTSYVTLARYLTSVSQFLHLKKGVGKMRCRCCKYLAVSRCLTMLHIHTDHKGNIKLTCRPMAEASTSFCRRMGIHKTQKGVMSLFFQAPDAPRQLLLSPEMDETFRTNGSFWGLRCFTHWKNHFLKICFFIYLQ